MVEIGECSQHSRWSERRRGNCDRGPGSLVLNITTLQCVIVIRCLSYTNTAATATTTTAAAKSSSWMSKCGAGLEKDEGQAKSLIKGLVNKSCGPIRPRSSNWNTNIGSGSSDATHAVSQATTVIQVKLGDDLQVCAIERKLSFDVLWIINFRAWK
ncbi:hypothetical protein O3P69_012790 [Scylla paramamosain]|uniref:Uncharacterized protein n=1 Tax=Scylla paramamosain TaxID=85552 RepID=A0AAW0SEG1_SCYPA